MNFSICFLIEGPINSAAYFRAIGMSTSIVKLGFEVSIICDDRIENIEKIAELKIAGIKVLSYCARPRIKSIFQLRKVLNNHKPDWVVQLNPTSKGLLGLVFTRHKVIGEWDEPRILAPQGLLKKLFSHVLHFWLKSRSKIHISCSRAFLEHLPKGKYIPHGQYVDNKNYRKNNSNEDYFVYLGNFFPLFDHDLLISGLESAAQRGFKPKIIMIGGGPDLEVWRSLCIKNNLLNITFMGYCKIEEWMPLLIGAKALLFPMRDTPLNRCRCSSKIFAYLASGKPVVAHKVGEVAELLDSVAYLAKPGEDLIGLLEKKIYQSIEVAKPSKNISYDYLSKIFIDEINRSNL